MSISKVATSSTLSNVIIQLTDDVQISTTHTQTHRHTYTDTHTDTHTQTQTHRHTPRRTYRHTHRHRHRHRHTDTRLDVHTDTPKHARMCASVISPISHCSGRKLFCRGKGGIIWAVGKFHRYLYGQHFTLESDHRPLQYLQSSHPKNARLMKCSVSLQTYRYTAGTAQKVHRLVKAANNLFSVV